MHLPHDGHTNRHHPHAHAQPDSRCVCIDARCARTDTTFKTTTPAHTHTSRHMPMDLCHTKHRHTHTHTHARAHPRRHTHPPAQTTDTHACSHLRQQSADAAPDVRVSLLSTELQAVDQLQMIVHFPIRPRLMLQHFKTFVRGRVEPAPEGQRGGHRHKASKPCTGSGRRHENGTRKPATSLAKRGAWVTMH